MLKRLKYLKKILRSYYFCFKYLPFDQAKKLPIFIDGPLRVIHLKRNSIVLKGDILKCGIWFGGGISGLSSRHICLEIKENGKLIFNEKAFIGDGCYIRIDDNACVNIGKRFGANCDCVIKSKQGISFGDDVMLGWCNEINDSDGHKTYVDGFEQESTKSIVIGKHTWITSNVKIGKGVEIANDCIVARGAVVTKKHIVPNSLIGGVPAKEIRDNIHWEK